MTSPPGQRNGGILSPAGLNVIFSTTTVSLTVTLHNTDSQAAQRVAVVLSLARGASASPIVRRETLADVGAGQSAQLRFAALGKVPLVTQTRLTLTLSGHAHPYAIVFTPPD